MKHIFFDDEHQYNLHVENGKYTLYYNNSDIWCSDVRNTVAFEMYNDCNRYSFKTNKKNRLDYSEAMYMYVILALEKESKISIGEMVRDL